MALRILKAYAPPGLAVETSDRMAAARRWLTATSPVITEDYAMRVMGMWAAGAPARELIDLAQPLLSEEAGQRPDGGWAQRPELASDAYATGMVLCALFDIGVLKADDPIYQKGPEFLRATQDQQGAWHVISRAAKVQPYFESGFPYGHDQWISMMGTGWAAGAIARALPDRAP